MKRNVMIGIFLALIFAYGVPAHGGNKETIELQEQVKVLGDRIASMQQSFDEKLATLQPGPHQPCRRAPSAATDLGRD
ncbi:MAG TPA: hypothetical protein VEH30_11495 [Terriglobales bacterium]|nr:hypothetical protein [Terriglobales bacterium]